MPILDMTFSSPLFTALMKRLLASLPVSPAGSDCQGGNGFKGQPGTHRLGAIAGEQGEMMYFARRAGVHHQTGAGAQAFAYQMMVHSGASQQRRDGYALTRDCPVGQDQHVIAIRPRPASAAAHKAVIAASQPAAPCVTG